MSFESRPPRPPEVEKARRANDKEKLSILGQAGNVAKARKREEESFREEAKAAVSRETREKSEWKEHTLYPSPTAARQDDLLPAEQ